MIVEILLNKNDITLIGNAFTLSEDGMCVLTDINDSTHTMIIPMESVLMIHVYEHKELH